MISTIAPLQLLTAIEDVTLFSRTTTMSFCKLISTLTPAATLPSLRSPRKRERERGAKSDVFTGQVLADNVFHKGYRQPSLGGEGGVVEAVEQGKQEGHVAAVAAQEELGDFFGHVESPVSGAQL